MKIEKPSRPAILVHPAPAMSRQARSIQIRKLSTAGDIFRHSPAGGGAAATRSGKGGKCGGGMGGMHTGGVPGGGKRKTHFGSK
jgi:hypothetical protein